MKVPLLNCSVQGGWFATETSVPAQDWTLTSVSVHWWRSVPACAEGARTLALANDSATG